MALLYRDLGIDLGTINTLIAEGGEIVLSEPTMAAIDVEEQKIVALGQEAKDMYGRVPEGIEVMYPLRDGVIADYEVTEKSFPTSSRKSAVRSASSSQGRW